MTRTTGTPGYAPVAKLLHWLVFAALVAQFAVGYSLERADDLLEGVVERWLDGEDGRLVLVHVALGSTILVLACIRLAWRKWAGLPPWAPGLSATERRVASRVEQVLYATMFLIPLTGFALVLVSGEDWELGTRTWQAPLELFDDDVWLGAHITTHIVFLGAFVVHVALVLKHQFWDRDDLLGRML